MLDVIQQRLRTPRNFTDKKTGAKTQLSLLRSNASFFKLSTDQHDGWIKALHLLKDKCQVEDWGDSAAGLPVLNNYLTQLFAAVINRYLEYHQADEDFKIKSIDPEYDAGIFFSDNDQYMSFNTGLYTNNFKKIFGHFTRNFHKNQQPWYFQGWMTDYEISYINGASLYRKKPMPFVFAKELHELYFNPFIQLNIDPEHILKDQGNLNQVQAVLQELNIVNCSKSELIQRLTGAVAMMVVRVQQNSRTVMPQYSAQTGVIQLLLPLSFTVDHTVQLVIPVSKEPLPRAQGVQADDWDPAQWQYIGRSVLATDVAYNNARLLNRIESEWLHLGRGNSADGLMSSSASLLSAEQRLHNAPQTASSAIPTVLSAPPNLVQLTHREKANQIKQICAVEATDDLSTLSEHSAAHTTEKGPAMQQQLREVPVKLKQHGNRQAHQDHPAHQRAGHSTDDLAEGPNKLPHQQLQLHKNDKHNSAAQNLRGPHQQSHKEGHKDQQLHGSNKRDGKNHSNVSQQLLLHVPTEVWHSRHEDKKEAQDSEVVVHNNETSRQQHRELELPSSNMAVLSAGGPPPVAHQVTASQQLLTAMTQHKTHTNSESISSAPAAPAPTTPVTPVSVEKKQADAELARRANSLNPNHPTYMGHEAKARYLKEHPNLPNSKETRETKFKAGGHVFEKNKPHQHQQPEDGRLDKPHQVSTSGSNIAVVPKTESVNAESHAPELITVPITPHSASPQSVPSQIVTPRSPPPLLPAGTRPGVHSGASRHPSATVSNGDVRTANLVDSSPSDQRGDSHSAQQQQQSEAVSSSSAHNSPKNHKARKGNRRDIDNVSLDSAEFPPVQITAAATRAAAPHQTNNTSAKTMPKHGGGGHWDRQKGSARNSNGENKIAQNAMRAITQQQQTPPLTQQTSQQQGHTATDKK